MVVRRSMGARASLAAVVAVIAFVASGCVFNGAWTLQAFPTSTAGRDVLTSVACPSATLCLAGGYRLPDPSSEFSHVSPRIAVLRDGTWTDRGVPDLGTGDKAYDGVACSSPSRCILAWSATNPNFVGTFYGADLWNDGVLTALQFGSSIKADDHLEVGCVPNGPCTLVSSGSTWRVDSSTATRLPHQLQQYPLSVECPTSEFCLVVTLFTVYGLRSNGFAPLPGQEPGTGVRWLDGSCVSGHYCEIVGLFDDGATGPPVAISGKWDGSTVSRTPVPGSASYWRVASCSSMIACLTLSGTQANDAAAFNGGTWYARPAPPAPTPVAEPYEDVACPPDQNWCVAVGGITEPAAAIYEWTDPPT